MTRSSLVRPALVTGAWLALTLIPQLGYLAERSAALPWSGLIAVNLLYAVLASLVTVVWMGQAPARMGSLRVWLPLLVLALAAAAALPAARGAAVPAALAAVAAVLPAAGGRSVLARWRGPVAGGLALLLSGLAVSGRGEGPPDVALAMIWGVYLIIAWVGWGELVARLAGVPHRLDWGLRAGLGLAVTVVFGGVLNLVWSVSAWALLTWLAIGFGAWVVTFESPGELLRRAARRPATVLALVMLTLLALLQMAGSVGGAVDTMVDTPPFDLHDDLQAYLVFPHEMLTRGSLGAQPFEARRMLSLGGQSLLQTLVLTALPTRALHLLDAGVCLVILVGVAWGAARAAGLGPGLSSLVAVTALVLPHPLMRGNTSAVLSGALALLVCFRLLREQPLPISRPGGAAMAALAVSATCALKSTLIPAAAVVMATAVAGCLLATAERRRAVAGSATALVLCGVFLLPWMISSFESSGTLLYPLLGRGFDGAVWSQGYARIAGSVSPSLADQVKAWSEPLVMLLPVWLLLALARGRRGYGATAAAGAALVVSVAAVVAFGDPTLSRAHERYLFPIEAAVMLILFVSALARWREGREGTVAAAAAIAVVGFVVAPGAGATWERTVDSALTAIEGGETVSPWDRLVADEVSASLPGGRTLATLKTPFLIDLDRHDVWIMSLPGMASPPPGLRLDNRPDEIAEYLRGQGVRSLAYGGMDELSAILSLTETRIVMNYPRSRTRWVMLRSHQRYQEIVRGLARSYKRLYDDGRTVVLDLARPVVTLAPGDVTTDWDGITDGVWTGERVTVRARDRPVHARVVLVRTMGWHPRPGAVVLDLEVDGRRLVPTGREGPVWVFAAERPIDHLGEIRLDVRAVASEGTAGEVVPVGIDLQAIEFADDPAVAGVPIRCALQPVAGALDPKVVTLRTGFFDDFNWTSESAEMRRLSWPTQGKTELVLSLYPVHPWRPDWARCGVRLFANGLELRPVGCEGDNLVYELYPGLREIQRVRIEARPFVPREVIGGDDGRTLGVPVRRLSLR